MKVAVCAVAKHENVYINDWIAWHLNLGFDHIYIFDNNEPNYPDLWYTINRNFKDKVTIMNLNYITAVDCNPNVDAYYQYFQFFTGVNDWCAFIDIDEFINLKGFTNIKDWLAEAPDECVSIGMPWRIFGDDGIIVGNTRIPVYERIKIDLTEEPRLLEKGTLSYGSTIKSIVRSKDRLIPMGAHSFGIPSFDIGPIRIDQLLMYDTKFRIIGKSREITYPLLDRQDQSVYLNHYITKTLSEFLESKLFRLHAGDWDGVSSGFNYFFRINEETEEKIEYINSFMGRLGITDLDYSKLMEYTAHRESEVPGFSLGPQLPVGDVE